MECGKVKLEVYAPRECIAPLRDALAAAGAGRVGNYDMCCSWHPVEGSWRPLEGADPYDGTVGKLSESAEYKLEMRCDKTCLSAAIEAIQAAHPYEEPLINIIPLLDEVTL